METSFFSFNAIAYKTTINGLPTFFYRKKIIFVRSHINRYVPEMRLLFFSKYLFLLFFFAIPVVAICQTPKPTTAPAKAPEPEKKNFKIISETKDKYGQIVRKVQYTQGATTITETLILPPFPALGERIKVNPDTLNHDSLMVLVDKTNYLVAILYKRKRIRQYRAVFGPDRMKDKMMEGDRCTPEGWFKIVSKKEHGSWQKFLLIDYPNQESYTKFNERKQNGTIPSGAQIGGAVGIHGTFLSGVKMVDWGVGWTDGCIALKPEDINDFYQFVFPGTKVFVRR